jgi:hypothetical protein
VRLPSLEIFLAPTSQKRCAFLKLLNNNRQSSLKLLHRIYSYLYPAADMALDWDSRKETITKLFSDREGTLDHVIRIMKKEFGFSAR